MKSIRKRDAVWAIIVLILLLFLSGDNKCKIPNDTGSVSMSAMQVASMLIVPDQEEKENSTEATTKETGQIVKNVEPEQKTEKLLPADQTYGERYYSVVKVIDGDTVNVSKDGETVTLRLIGLDTPETVHPSKPVECFGKEASDKAKAMLTGKQVRIEMDSSQGTYGKYGRTLAYVYLEDGTHFNKYMIEEGYGYEYTYDLPYKYQAEFKQAQQEAQVNKRGLWASNVCDVAVEELNISKEESTDTTQGQTDTGGYICSYNAYNCGDFSTYLEAQTAYDACGGVNNDIHRLDKDKDGLACESLP